jgi:Mg-chelatase subunit ChlD
MKVPSSLSIEREDELETNQKREDQEEGTGPEMDRMQKGEELDGKLNSDFEEERLAHTVIEADKDKIDSGMLIDEAFNQNMGGFMPDMMMKEMVTNYKNAEKLFGQTVIRELSGYDPRYIDKNIKIPEFQREVQRKISDKVQELQDKGVVKKSGGFTKEALDAAALFMMEQEFKQTPKGYSFLGEQVHKIHDQSGEKSTVRPYKKTDAFRNLALRATIKQSIRRGHNRIEHADLQTYDREARQQINIVYCLDTSGSMKGEKIRLAKKAGIALANKAIHDQNKVGLVTFGSTIQKKVRLTKDFFTFVRPLTTTTTGNETDIGLAIKQAQVILHGAKGIKHIVLITDGQHTRDENPTKAVLEEVAKAQHDDISVSVVGIGLDEEGLELVKQVVDHAQGNLYAVHATEDIGGVVIADYNSLL